MKVIINNTEVDDALLADIAEFLVESQDTVTENMKTDFFYEVDEEEFSLENWTKALVKTMLEDDSEYTFIENNVDIIVKMLLDDNVCRTMLEDEYNYLHNEYLEDY